MRRGYNCEEKKLKAYQPIKMFPFLNKRMKIIKYVLRLFILFGIYWRPCKLRYNWKVKFLQLWNMFRNKNHGQARILGYAI